MRVLSLAAKTLPKRIVSLSGDIERLECGKRLYHVNIMDTRGNVVEADYIQIVADDDSVCLLADYSPNPRFNNQ